MQLYQYLSSEVGASKEEISYFARSAPKKYKIYSIPKRTSGRRIIAHPAKKLKEYQRALVKLLENSLPIHKAAFAYKKNIGIKHNAKIHVHSKYLLKLDFQNFFYSITPQLFLSLLDKLDLELTREDKNLLTQLLFWSPSRRSNGKLILSVGAPSSPFVSNFVMYFFDKELYENCKNLNIAYSRYADDLTFSTNEKNLLFDIPDLIRSLLVSHFGGKISLNESKTVFSSKAHNRHVTGVTLTNEGKLSIGRERKRYISSLIHKFSIGQLSRDDFRYLQGLLAFASDIEPEFKQRMIRKYSSDTLDSIFRGNHG